MAIGKPDQLSLYGVAWFTMSLAERKFTQHKASKDSNEKTNSWPAG